MERSKKKRFFSHNFSDSKERFNSLLLTRSLLAKNRVPDTRHASSCSRSVYARWKVGERGRLEKVGGYAWFKPPLIGWASAEVFSRTPLPYDAPASCREIGLAGDAGRAVARTRADQSPSPCHRGDGNSDVAVSCTAHSRFASASMCTPRSPFSVGRHLLVFVVPFPHDRRLNGTRAVGGISGVHVPVYPFNGRAYKR